MRGIFYLYDSIFFGVNLSCVTLFYDPGREDFGELISIPGKKFSCL